MPLLDHFHPPLNTARHWQHFHGRWAYAIADALNNDLPDGYFSEALVKLGGGIEVDSPTFEEPGASPSSANGGGTATATAAGVTVVAVEQALPLAFPDSFEVQVFNTRSGPTLVAAVELVSPGNKDRPEARRAFLAKCLNYLTQGIGLIVIDVVTERRANLHDELVRWMGLAEPFLFPAEAPLYAVAYRPVRRAPSADQADLWRAPLAVGEPLPVLPLALRGDGVIAVDLEAAYSEARQRTRWPGQRRPSSLISPGTTTSTWPAPTSAAGSIRPRTPRRPN